MHTRKPATVTRRAFVFALPGLLLTHARAAAARFTALADADLARLFLWCSFTSATGVPAAA